MKCCHWADFAMLVVEAERQAGGREARVEAEARVEVERQGQRQRGKGRAEQASSICAISQKNHWNAEKRNIFQHMQ